MQNHSELIQQLTPLLQDENFDSLLDQSTSHLSDSDRFLVRMEMRRLNQNCQRRIDMSNQSERCDWVELDGLEHRITAEAEHTLRQQLELYGGRYTVGAYEALMDSLKPEPEPELGADEEPEALRPFNMATLPMGYYIRRRETRHSFTSNVTLWQQDGAPVEGRTLDLSPRGVKLRCRTPWFPEPTKPIFVSYTDIAKEFTVPELKQGVSYELVEREERKDGAQFRLKRTDDDDKLDNTFERILSVSRLRTRPELNHLIKTARSRGYERQYLPRLASVPVAMSLKGGKLQPSMVLQTPTNSAQIDYWLDERGASQLSSALTDKRIARILKQPKESSHQLMYSFVHYHGDHKLFFSATLFELQQQELLNCFLKHAAGKDEFRVHHLQMHSIGERDRQWATHSPVNGRQSQALVNQQLNGVSLLIHMESHRPERPEIYQALYSDQHVNQLRQFGQLRVSGAEPRAIPCEQQELRREPRFALQTKVQIEVQGVEITGRTLDVSPRGLRVQLEESINIAPGSQLKLAFPDLQPLAGKLKLKNLDYQLVRHQKGVVLHLKVSTEQNHSGVVFLSHLLHQNRDKMTQVGSKMQHRQLFEGMKNLVLKRLYSLPVFIHKEGPKFVANLAGNSLVPSSCYQSLVDMDGLDLDAIFDHADIKQRYEELAKQKHDSPAWFGTLIVYWPQDREQRQVWELSQFADSQQLRHKMEQLYATGHLKVLSIQLDKAKRPDLDYLQAELAAISTHALHRAKELEQMLWQIEVVAEIRDITPEYLQQYLEVVETGPATAAH
ncbi:PilZ domain-containing protein [Ferrimonas aestuarii]|uniref:PilZ domain-containing protein n=1 Tax=Ferrimonas aestuarii TaxID=2569539 RepID=A0A4U1BNA5_9GAMM|nr:PilZ domain-containing protein [Ferrimonas aestuarii]TKB55403.1 PilZ domain-containing protein [Ferrimonas aestuarii]